MASSNTAPLSQLQLKVGFAFLCLGTLVLHAILRYFPKHTDSALNHPSHVASDYDSHAIRESIDKLSEELYKFQVNITPFCSKESSAEHDLNLLVIAGTLTVLLWMLGMLIVMIGLHHVSLAYQQEVVPYGVVAANLSLVFIMTMMPGRPWYRGLLYTTWASWAGIIVGVLFGDGTQVNYEKGDEQQDQIAPTEAEESL